MNYCRVCAGQIENSEQGVCDDCIQNGNAVVA